MARTFYRIVKANPPTESDFTPRPLRQNVAANPQLQELASGISVWTTRAQAQRAAREFPKLGGFIARLEIPAQSELRVEKTLGRGHYTIWGDAAILHRLVVLTTPMAG